MYIPTNLTVWGYYMDVRLRNYILIKMQTNQKDLTLISHKPILEQAYCSISAKYLHQRAAKHMNIFLRPIKSIVTHSQRSSFEEVSVLVISTLFSSNLPILWIKLRIFCPQISFNFFSEKQFWYTAKQ